MLSPTAERAIEESLENSAAILKFISPNDAGITGGHQCGFHLPKIAWEMFTPNQPIKGCNADSRPQVTWQDGRVTDSRVVWYGKGTRSEYRLTRFGKDFPFLHADTVGDLFVLIPKSHDEFSAYVLDLEEDIEGVCATLGVEVMAKAGAVYRRDAIPEESEGDCVERRFAEFIRSLDEFPSTSEFANVTQKTLEECVRRFISRSLDDRLLDLVHAEYDLFRRVERRLCAEQIHRLFKSVDEFLQTASSILNRRKSRAGRSLENHFEYILKAKHLRFEVRSAVDGEPDVLFPSRQAYEDTTFPTEKLFMVGVKTTCKDRWRQVLNEASRIPNKHILTVQRGISTKQLAAMNEANVTLIVPKKLQKEYPKDSKAKIITVENFVSTINSTLGVSDG